MELLKIDCLGKQLRLEGSMAGWQQLFWDRQLVSQLAATAQTEHSRAHQFELLAKSQLDAVTGMPLPDEGTDQSQLINIKLETEVCWQPFLLKYRLFVNNELQSSGERNSKDIEQQQPELTPEKPKQQSWLGLASLGFKLFKSAKVIKVVLAGASVAAYSWLFSLQFALALLACLVFHEYGHIRAMKYFGMKTKGIYLIPFLGGLALSDEKITPAGRMWSFPLWGPPLVCCSR